MDDPIEILTSQLKYIQRSTEHSKLQIEQLLNEIKKCDLQIATNEANVKKMEEAIKILQGSK